MPSKTFVVSDESVNSYGFRVLTEGIQLGNFKKNPVMFFNHDTGGSFWYRDPSYTGPIGRWENIKKENGELLAEAVFDQEDPKGKSLHNKVENDFIRAASIGFRVIATSNDPALMEKGQTYPTITKCELMEISVCDIPANKNALALYDADGNRINLEDTQQLSFALSAVGQHVKLQPAKPNPNKMKLTFLAVWTALSAFFGVKHEDGKESTEVDVSQDKLSELNSRLALVSQLEADNKKLKEDAGKVKDEHAKALKAEQDRSAGLETKVTELTGKFEKLEKKPEQEPGKAAGENKETSGPTDLGSGSLAELNAFSFDTHNLSEKDKKAITAANS